MNKPKFSENFVNSKTEQTVILKNFNNYNNVRIRGEETICICCICFDGLVIADQCTATFSDPLCPPNFGITRT